MAPSFAAATADIPAADNSFLTADEKALWAEKGTPFFINSVALDEEGRFDPGWVLNVIKAEDDTPRRIRLSCNARRDLEMQALGNAIGRTGEAVGPCALRRKVLAGGNTTWLIVDLPPQTVAPF